MCQYNYIGNLAWRVTRCRGFTGLQSRSDDRRTVLSGLARTTIAKSERIVRKFKELVAGNRGLDSGMKSLLRDMRNFLGFSEEKLKEAEDTIRNFKDHFIKPHWSSFVNISGLQLFEKDIHLISFWKSRVRDLINEMFGYIYSDFRAEWDEQDIHDEIEEIIHDADVEEIYDCLNYLKEAAMNYL